MEPATQVTVTELKQVIRGVMDNDVVIKDTLVFLRDHYPQTVKDAGADVVLAFETLNQTDLVTVHKYVMLALFRQYLAKLETTKPAQYESILAEIKAKFPDATATTTNDDDDGGGALDIASIPLDFVYKTMTGAATKVEPKLLEVPKVFQKKPAPIQKPPPPPPVEFQKEEAAKQFPPLAKEFRKPPAEPWRARTKDDVEKQEAKVYGVLELLREELKVLAEIKGEMDSDEIVHIDSADLSFSSYASDDDEY